jgi:hypothetical protein
VSGWIPGVATRAGAGLRGRRQSCHRGPGWWMSRQSSTP